MWEIVNSSEALGVAVQSRNRLLREAVAAQISREPDLRIVGTTARWTELPRLCQLRHPQVIIFDVAEVDPFAIVAALRVQNRQLHLVGLYEGTDVQVAERAHDAGVQRLVPYGDGVEALLSAIREPGWNKESAGLRTAMVTDRDLRILRLISCGFTLGQIAEALEKTPRAVESHKRRIYAKLQVNGQAHAAAYAARFGLLHVPASPEPCRLESSLSSLTPLAMLSGAPGPLVDRVTRLLLDGGIPLIDRSSEPVTVDHPARHLRGALVVVLVDPAPGDWSTPLDLPCRIIVVLSSEPDQADLVDIVMRGADCLLRAADLDQLVLALRLVTQGYLLINAAQARRFIGAAFTKVTQMRSVVPLKLTLREEQILASVGQGHSVKQTARFLGISVKTVESLQSRLFRKLGTRGRAQALVVAYGLGLLPLPQNEDI
jgi:DNA-binding NarL/FixJ family response regulator